VQGESDACNATVAYVGGHRCGCPGTPLGNRPRTRSRKGGFSRRRDRAYRKLRSTVALQGVAFRLARSPDRGRRAARESAGRVSHRPVTKYSRRGRKAETLVSSARIASSGTHFNQGDSCFCTYHSVADENRAGAFASSAVCLCLDRIREAAGSQHTGSMRAVKHYNPDPTSGRSISYTHRAHGSIARMRPNRGSVRSRAI